MSVYRSIRSCCVFGTIGLSILLSAKYAEFKTVAHSVQENKCAEKFEICEEAYRANNRGVAQLEQFNPAEAVKEFRKALTINADLKIAQVNLAIALLNAQQADEAREAAEKAIA
jgi:tetratricopeptide (TPR) repeat protein